MIVARTDEHILKTLLDAREERWQRRIALSRCGMVLTLTLNLPGSNKLLPKWLSFYSTIQGDFLNTLLNKSFEIVHTSSHVSAAGPEDHFLFPASLQPENLKCAAIEFEELHPAGRLIDIDIMAYGGELVSRENLKLPQRKCLCCSNSAKVCAVLAAHPIDEVMKVAERLIDTYQKFSR